MGQYTLPDLPYDYGALEPYISGQIMELHHSKHHAAYVTGANTTLDQLAELLDPDDAVPEDAHSIGDGITGSPTRRLP